MNGPYDDIIDLPHPVSKKHPAMKIYDRAAQFSPFAALTGYEAAIRETARFTGRRIELDEDEKAALDRKLHMTAERAGEYMEVSVTCFEPDKTKEGGSYKTVCGCIKKIDDYRREIVLMDGRRISMDDIIDIESESESEMEDLWGQCWGNGDDLELL